MVQLYKGKGSNLNYKVKFGRASLGEKINKMFYGVRVKYVRKKYTSKIF